MSVSFIELASAALSGSTVPWLLKAAFRRLSGVDSAEVDREKAEARKFNAEANEIDWRRMRDEIARLQERVERQDQRIADLERLDEQRVEREAALKKENACLKAQVKRLERRIAGLEAIFKIGPVPPAMQEALDKLKEIDQ